MRWTGLAPILLIAVLTACGKNTIVPKGAEKSVVDVVVEKTGFHPTDAKCPPDVEAKVGGTFECHFTGPEGVDYTARMLIRKVDGTKVLFGIRTAPTG